MAWPKGKKRSAKTIELLKATLAAPEVRARRAQAMRARWADPEARARLSVMLKARQDAADRHAEIVAMLNAGASQKAVAVSFDVTPAAISRIAIKAGLRRQKLRADAGAKRRTLQ